MENPYLSLILPAFNEAQRIAQTIQNAADYFAAHGISYEIIVSADGNDGTREIVSEIRRANPHVTVIGSAQRRGKGLGIREAVKIARGEIVGFADADDKTPIAELDKFIPYLEAGWDLVIGSRAQRESVIERRQPLYRQIGSRGFGMYFHLVVGLWDIADTQCGFKFMQGGVARELFSRQVIDGYMFDVEVLYLARQSGYRIQQVPVHWRDDGDSRLNLFAGNLRNFTDVLKIRFDHKP